MPFHLSTAHRDFSFSSWGRPDREEVGNILAAPTSLAAFPMRVPSQGHCPSGAETTPTPGRGQDLQEGPVL